MKQLAKDDEHSAAAVEQGVLHILIILGYFLHSTDISIFEVELNYQLDLLSGLLIFR